MNITPIMMVDLKTLQLRMDEVAASSSGELIREWIRREIESHRSSLEIVKPEELPILQGRIQSLRSLDILLTPKPTRGSVPPINDIGWGPGR